MDRRQLLNDSEETTRITQEGHQSRIWTAIPCIVHSVNLSAMTIEAQPAIQGSVEDELGNVQNVNLPLLVDVPLIFPSAGGFTITFPVAVGDEVLVLFSSRCIDSWWQSGGIGVPMESRMHDLSDGFALPGPKSQPNVVAGISATDMQIRNNAGSSFISIGADGSIKLTAPTVTVTGNLVVSGTVSGGPTGAPISLETHTHTSAAPGSPTGPPLP